MVRKIASIVFLFAASSCGLFAQNASGTGGIAGVVTDATGAIIPGANVTVENESKGIRRQLTTTGGGVFDAPSLTPAPGYTVTITKAGFATYEARNITIQVGETVSLTPALQVSSSTTKVEVTAEAPVVNGEKTDVSQVVNTLQIQDLPINGRRVDSFVLLTPGVAPDASFGLLTFRGNPGGNSFLTDGIDTTNNFYDENAGRTRTYNISQDAVQEFQVISSNFNAEYGNASGGVVNTITRSGTNAYHGTAYWFFRNRTLEATDPTANGLRPPEWRHQAGASIGGPIKKDKLFFFFNGELQRRYFPIVSTNVGNTSMFNVNGQFVGTGASNGCNAPASAAQCAAAISYIQGRQSPQLVSRTADVNLLFGKVDYQINERNRWSTELNYLDFRSPNGIQTQASLTTGNAVGNNANTTVFDRTLKSGLTSVISPNIVNEARFGLFKDRQYDPASPSLLPSIGPVALTVNGLSNLGYATSYPRLLPSELRLEGSDTLSWTFGKHSFKFGVDYSHVEDYIYSLSNQYGTYSYPTLTAFALDFSGNTTGARNYTSYSQRFGNPSVDLNFNEIGVFAQDEWHVTPKLTISPGVRYDYSTIPQPTQVNPTFPQTGNIPDHALNLAPRFGIAYQLNDKTVIRAGYGMFFNRYVSAAVESMFFGNGLYQPSISFSGATVSSGAIFPGHLATAVCPSVACANITYADPAYRNGYSQQSTLAVERQIAHDTALTVSYVWSRGLHITSASDANVGAPTGSYTYAVLNAQNQQVGSYTTPLYLTSDRINKNYVSVIEMQSNANSYYNGLLVQLQKRYSGWFQADASYTYSHTIDDDIGGAAGGPGGSSGILYAPSFPTSVFNGDEKGEKGSAATDERHRLTLSGVLNPKLSHGDSWMSKYVLNGWQLSVISTLGSSFPLPPSISVNSKFEPAGLDSTSTLNGLGGSTRVPFESISALDVNPIFRTDARLSHIWPIGERLKMTLLFEAQNVFNHFILEGSTPRQTEQYTTGANPNVSGGANVPLGIALIPYPAYGAATQTQAPPDGTTARRAQAAIRFEW